MKAVLQDYDGDYFTGMGLDKFYMERPLYSPDFTQARVFTFRVKEGKVEVEPELPEAGSWKIVPLTLKKMEDT